MKEFFFDAHSIWQYVALAAVLASLAFSLQRAMSPTAERMYRVTAVVVDIQVTLGIVLWILASGWSLGFAQGWLHPILGIAAAGVLHAAVGRARSIGAEEGNRRVRFGLIAVLVLVAAAIGIGDMA